MPTLLTIPTETRLKILNHAISDLRGSGCTISANGLSGVLNNPNVNIHLICRQIRYECISPQVRTPMLEVHHEGPPHNWRFLWFKAPGGYGFKQHCSEILQKMMTQLSALVLVYDIGQVYQQWIDAWPPIDQRTFDGHVVIYLIKDIRWRHLEDSYDVGIEITRNEAKSDTTTTTVTIT